MENKNIIYSYIRYSVWNELYRLYNKSRHEIRVLQTVYNTVIDYMDDNDAFKEFIDTFTSDDHQDRRIIMYNIYDYFGYNDVDPYIVNEMLYKNSETIILLYKSYQKDIRDKNNYNDLVEFVKNLLYKIDAPENWTTYKDPVKEFIKGIIPDDQN